MMRRRSYTPRVWRQWLSWWGLIASELQAPSLVTNLRRSLHKHKATTVTVTMMTNTGLSLGTHVLQTRHPHSAVLPPAISPLPKAAISSPAVASRARPDLPGCLRALQSSAAVESHLEQTLHDSYPRAVGALAQRLRELKLQFCEKLDAMQPPIDVSVWMLELEPVLSALRQAHVHLGEHEQAGAGSLFDHCISTLRGLEA